MQAFRVPSVRSASGGSSSEGNGCIPGLSGGGPENRPGPDLRSGFVDGQRCGTELLYSDRAGSLSANSFIDGEQPHLPARLWHAGPSPDSPRSNVRPGLRPPVRLLDRNQHGRARNGVVHLVRSARGYLITAVHLGDRPPARRVRALPLAVMLLAEVDLIRTLAANDVGVVLRIDLQQRPGDDIPWREALSAALDLPVIDPSSTSCRHCPPSNPSSSGASRTTPALGERLGCCASDLVLR